MRILVWILSVSSLLLVFSTAICGMWIRGNRDKIADLASAASFHMNLGIATTVVVVAAIVIMAVIILKR